MPFGHKNNVVHALAAAMCLSLLFLSASCKKSEEKKGAGAPPPVSVVKAEERAIPLVFETFGLVEPYEQINVKSKLTGKITALGFAPGQRVKKGDLLVQMDDREYQANLKKYQAQLAKNRILSEDAARILAMKEELARSRAVTQTEMFTQKAISESLAAALEADLAEIDNTKLNIEYSRIAAPFDGVAGDILIHLGSIVKANDDIIVKLTQIKPVYVAFSLPERMLASIRALQATGRKVEVVSSLSSDNASNASIVGELAFIDNQVDAASGTIKMKAKFGNADERLWPGQYANVKVELSKDERFVAVPTDSIMSGQNGQQVFIVKDGDKVELRAVEPGRSYEGFTAVKGVAAGEQVVLTGQFRLAPGVKVSIKGGAGSGPESK